MRTSKAVTLDSTGNPRRSEVWEAWHQGWHLERLEVKGTPWVATLTATGESSHSFPSLRSLTEAIDSGQLSWWLDGQRALRAAEWMAATMGHR